jgi:hypothetical protein
MYMLILRIVLLAAAYGYKISVIKTWSLQNYCKFEEEKTTKQKNSNINDKTVGFIYLDLELINIEIKFQSNIAYTSDNILTVKTYM